MTYRSICLAFFATPGACNIRVLNFPRLPPTGFALTRISPTRLPFRGFAVPEFTHQASFPVVPSRRCVRNIWLCPGLGQPWPSHIPGAPRACHSQELVIPARLTPRGRASPVSCTSGVIIPRHFHTRD